jgi:membrane protease YdiL (CAAX protease family)
MYAELPRPLEWLFSAALFALCVAYVQPIWGALAFFPEVLRKWGHFYYPLVGPWWTNHVLLSRTPGERQMALFLTASCVLAMIIPGIVLWLVGRAPTDTGLAVPNRLGWRIIFVSVAGSIPFGFWFTRDAAFNPNEPLITPSYVLSLLTMIPEHFFICGVVTALMLPSRRLPNPVPLAPISGSRPVRFLRWIGLAQPASAPSASRALSWFGLSARQLVAILASGIIFGLIHVGKPDQLEVVLSFPGGVTVAYVTLRARSIWPAILAHWSMNLIPVAFLAL